ncbi:hypothetical protein KKE14_01110 [Patescibacteria group bacterium]|nr:hypothetical protein [Patescibacteria group bacterium]
MSVTHARGSARPQAKLWLDFTKRFPQTTPWLKNLGNGSRLVRNDSLHSKIVGVPDGVSAVELIEFLGKKGVMVKSLLDSDLISLRSAKGEISLCFPFLIPRKKSWSNYQFAAPFGQNFYDHEKFVHSWQRARIAGVTEVLFLCVLYFLADEKDILPVMPIVLVRCGDPITPKEANIAVRIVPPACTKEKNGSILITTVDKHTVDANIVCLPFLPESRMLTN